MESSRLNKLNKLLDAIVFGRMKISSKNSPQFIEAICEQSDHVGCIIKITSKQDGLDALQQSMHHRLEPNFYNGDASKLLKYLQSPKISDLGSGTLLREVVQRIVDPPLFWDHFRQSSIRGLLSNEAQQAFGWLLHYLVADPSSPASYRDQAIESLPILLQFPDPAVSALGAKIQAIVEACNTTPTQSVVGVPGPGGRHDNDFPDFRKIAIAPTAEEISCSKVPFLRRSSEVDSIAADIRIATHLDNQFRLLREDMINEMREELQVAFGKKQKGFHRGTWVTGLELSGIHCGPDTRRCSWGLTFKCKDDLSLLKGAKDRKKTLIEHRNVLRHQSMSCLVVDDDIVAFPTINRDEDLLARNPPIIILHVDDEVATRNTLLKLKTGKNIKILQIDTAIFSFAPILEQLQKIRELPLLSELMLWKSGGPVAEAPHKPAALLRKLEANLHGDLQGLLKTPKSITLDKFQGASLVSGLSQSFSLIQGPPGTGKSLIGALVAKALYEYTDVKILVVCYTNHALDDILTSLLDIGIPVGDMVRMGGKSTQRTDPLMIYKQQSSYKRDRGTWTLIDNLKAQLSAYHDDLQRKFSGYLQANVSQKDILEHLEFYEPEFFEAFTVPEAGEGGLQFVGRGGSAVNKFYLIDRWSKGQNAGVFVNEDHIRGAQDVWSMRRDIRLQKLENWKGSILSEQIELLDAVASKYNGINNKLAHQWSEKDTQILKEKRIIGCTTTAAAKYSKSIQAASADVLLVEEAGEILESHILTALSSNTKQLIMIGDHKQLRPKVNHYQLTVEKGEGFDLNRSLFERQILKGYPHLTLTKQHRMRPQISNLIRALTYPELSDAPSTLKRPDIRGIQSNIVFISHAHPEDPFGQVSDRRDGGSKSSKQNTYEVQMVLKILRYLAQQGYTTDQMVILTPYLGQLHKLRAALKAGKDTDPVLNDLDSFDLVKAGLMTQAAADMAKKPIRLATIGESFVLSCPANNYQGEESDIVIASLTRSNPENDIGFMVSPERLNVLLSRARNALIILGNADTFTRSKKGGELWGKLFKLLRSGNHVFDGLPIQCQRHPDRKTLLKISDDFDLHSPDGGCTEPCGIMLNCGLHPCPSKCHQIADHSKMDCQFILRSSCPAGHQQSWKCHSQQPASCRQCERAARAAEAKREKEYKLQQEREAEQRKHEQVIDSLNAQVAQREQEVKDLDVAQQREDAIRLKQEDLKAMDARVEEMKNRPQTVPMKDRAPEAVEPQKPTPIPRPAPPVALDSNSATPSDLSRAKKSSPTTTVVPCGNTAEKPQGDAEPNQQPLRLPPHNPKPIPPLSPSKSEGDWEREKTLFGANNIAIDGVMAMTGLEKVKSSILELKGAIETKARQGVSSKHMRLNVAFLGNPGTGKTTIARQYAKFLASINAIPSDCFEETRGADLANDGVSGAKKLLEKVNKAGGGTIFIDEAYQLTEGHNFQGKQVLDFLLAEMENNTGKIVFIVAGYNREMDSFFEHNPGLRSRVPTTFLFEDYNDSELLTMFKAIVHRRYKGKMEIEDGLDGLYVRVAIRRLGRGRGRPGFGNARDLENLLDRIDRHQANRLRDERQSGRRTNDLLICAEDIIGPRPSNALGKSAAWTKLHAMIGLKAVKDAIRNLTNIVELNYDREVRELAPVQLSLNRILLGSPGTGKTTVASLYGQILSDLRLISNGEVVVKNPADFVGSALGQSEEKTKAILATTIGKVLIIDEAYMLHGGLGGGEGGGNKDPYKTAVIDTIVAEVHNKPGDDRCVLLLGYREKMMEMFQNVNEGLSRRFAIEDPFNFEDFTNKELLQILDKKLGEQDIHATDMAKATAIGILDRSRNQPNFGNAGEVENLLSAAKLRYQTRIASENPCPYDIILQPADFDPDFDRDARSAGSLKQLFEDVVGFDDLIGTLESYQKLVQVTKQRKNADYRELIPFNFVFKGPPGTGKTTVARKMGKVYYDMGILSTTEVVECSATDLVAQYVGQTGPKTLKQLEKGLGKVLFIDEAYRLSEGPFAQEAIDELVGLLTQDKFKGKLIVILAGYDKDMNRLLAVNSGLASRFPEQIMFHSMAPDHCIQLLRKQLNKNNVVVHGLDSPLSETYQEIATIFGDLSRLPSWGNARDVITLSKNMIKNAFLAAANSPVDDAANVVLDASRAIGCVQNMLKEQSDRCQNMPDNSSRTNIDMPMQTNTAQPPPPSKINLDIHTRTEQNVERADKPSESNGNEGRDPNVSDEVWKELQRAKQAEEERQKREAEEAAKQKEEAETQVELARRKEEEIQRLQEVLKKAQEERERLALMRKLEAERLRAAEARQKAAELERRRREEEERRKKEQQREVRVQAALRQMGVCVAGFRWIKTHGGYRCAGGSHFVPDSQLPS